MIRIQMKSIWLKHITIKEFIIERLSNDLYDIVPLATLMLKRFIQITFRRHLSIEPFSIYAVIINQVVISDQLHLTHLSTIQLVVHGRSPPISRGIGGTLINADSSIPIASPGPKLPEPSYERCIGPIDLDSPTLSCPTITIPNANIDPHSLFIGISYPLVLVVPENTNWHTINVPPENMVTNSESRKLEICSTVGMINC